MERRNNNKEQTIMPVSEKKKASNYKWDRENMTIAAVRLRNEVKEEFRDACERNGTNMNAVLLECIKKYIEQNK